MPRALVAAGVAVALAPLCSCDRASGGRDAKPAAAEARAVRTAPVATGSLERVAPASGTLAAHDQAVLGLKVAGHIAAIDVDLGSRVRRGDPIARLVPTDFELRLAQAAAALEQARARLGLAPGAPAGSVQPERTSLVRQAVAARDDARVRHERARALFDRALLPQSELDIAESALLVAEVRVEDALDEIRNRQGLLAERQSALDLAAQQLQDAVLTAPFDGAVQSRHVTVGEYVTPGQPVATLVRVDPLRLRLEVPEREAAGIRVGQTVRVSVTGDPTAYPGLVARVSPAIAETSRTLLVEAEVPNPDGALRAGAFAKAEVVLSAGDPALLVPAAALVSFAGVDRVFTVKDGKAVERRVRVGRRVGSEVEILEGLDAGGRVVLEPGNLVDEQPVVEASS